MINEIGWIDAGFFSSPYTWNNRRRGAANIMKLLDRGFTNDEWKFQFHEAMIIHLQVIRLDHRPLLIYRKTEAQTPPKPFKFEGMWRMHPVGGFVINKE